MPEPYFMKCIRFRYFIMTVICVNFVSCQTSAPFNVIYEIEQIDPRVEITHVQLFQDGEGFSLRGAATTVSNTPIEIHFKVYNEGKELLESTSMIYIKRYKRNTFFQTFSIDPTNKLVLLINAEMK